MLEKLKKDCVSLLKEREMFLTTVESCTGGALAAEITGVPGASGVYRQGFITYCNEAKQQLVQVAEETLNTFGAVSAPCAREMAEGGCLAARADAALSVTGFAGPEGGKEAPVGTVYIGCCVRGKTEVKEFHFNGDRSSVRTQAVIAALSLLRECILEGEEC